MSQALLLSFLGIISAILTWYFVFYRKRNLIIEDAYTRGLEQWLNGDLESAVASMRNAIDNNPSSFDPYLQLANLLREIGDARRAAAIHRGLTVRSDLNAEKKFSVSLALAQDLIELKNWDEAKQLLDQLQKFNPSTNAFWESRFLQWDGMNQPDKAAKTLHKAIGKVTASHSERFSEKYELYQLNRAQIACSDNDTSLAKKIVKNISEESNFYPFRILIEAQVALLDEDFNKCTELSTDGLLNFSEHSELFFPILEKALLSSGRYERAIPILESASQNAKVPASLIVALAILYEKTGDRERAVRLLSNKENDPGFTALTVAPFLKLLVNDLPSSDFTFVWNSIYLSSESQNWSCAYCKEQFSTKRWYCKSCNNFDSVFLSSVMGVDED